MQKCIKKCLQVRDEHITELAEEIFWNSYVSGLNIENLLEQCAVKNMRFCVRGKNFWKKIDFIWYFIWIYRKESFI